MYELGCRLGADRISFAELCGIDPALNYSEADVPAIAAQFRQILQADTQGRIENLLWSRGAGPAILAIQNELRPEVPPLRIDTETRFCFIAWHSMTIIGSEAVYPCCFLFQDPDGRLDDLRGRSLQDVWRGPNYTRLRAEFRRWFLLKMRVPLFSRANRFLKYIAPATPAAQMSYSLRTKRSTTTWRNGWPRSAPPSRRDSSGSPKPPGARSSTSAKGHRAERRDGPRSPLLSGRTRLSPAAGPAFSRVHGRQSFSTQPPAAGYHFPPVPPRPAGTAPSVSSAGPL